MAFVVARRDGRFEIRESSMTSEGPRARTLGTFRVLTPDVLDRAEARAAGRFDRGAIAERAAALGAGGDARATTRLAWELLARVVSGEGLPPTLRAALATQLGDQGKHVSDALPAVLDWLGVGAHERGEALRDLLRMTDRIPPRPDRARRAFPRIASAAP